MSRVPTRLYRRERQWNLEMTPDRLWSDSSTKERSNFARNCGSSGNRATWEPCGETRHTKKAGRVLGAYLMSSQLRVVTH